MVEIFLMNGVEITALLIKKSLAFIYFMGFLIALKQFPQLLGERGLLPLSRFLKRSSFKLSPSLFWLSHSDRSIKTLAWGGVLLSLAAFSGVTENYGMILSMSCWFLLWLFYLSFVNVGQTFYGFGWESLLLEIGFLAIFLGPEEMETPEIVIWLFRWILFRVMFGAGLIKIRGDKCWRDLTCLHYHYQTQPIPNPLSWYFHKIPSPLQKASVAFTHFVELFVPWFYFAPAPLCWIAGGLTIIFQVTLIFSGNLSWLNYVTIVIALSCFNDTFWINFLPERLPENEMTLPFKALVGALTLLIFLLSIAPTRNLFSRHQRMNASYDVLHLVNTYGAFGSVSRKRYELIIQGTDDHNPGPFSNWKEYEFKGKPGNTVKSPPIISPYHYRLDWQIWFAAMNDYQYHPWILHLVAKLLRGEKEILTLMGKNPFPEKPPRFIRIIRYEYSFTEWGDKSRHWWKRKWVGEYLPTVNLENPSFQEILKRMGWDSKVF